MDRDMPDEQFIPDTVDEQVETFLQQDYQHDLDTYPNARLTNALAITYQENRRILEHVWQRLATHPVVQQPGDMPPFHEGISPMQPVVSQSPARTGRSRLSLLVATLVALLLLGSTLAAFALVRQASSQPSSHIQTPAPHGTAPVTSQPTYKPTQGSTSLPATLSTSCPAAGSARAMVTTPLALKNRTTLIYLVIDATASTLKRYDLAAGQRTEIVHLPGVTITSAQVSADGQWVLFAAGPKLQVVRVDGRGLQTLYCDPALGAFQWSTNQQWIAFETRSGNTGLLKILAVGNGVVKIAFSQPLNTPYTYQLRTWLDNSRLYLTRTDTDVPPDSLAILDLNKGLNQTTSSLITVVKPQPGSLQDFDSSFDGKQVFLAHSPCTYACTGPGDIIQEPALGGSPLTLFSSTYSIVQLRVATPKNLLFLTKNRGFPNQNNGDLSHNGLWTLHMDGTDTKTIRLTSDSAGQSSILNAYSQYPWSNASRDNQWYAVEQDAPQASGRTGETLLIGSLSGGTPSRFVWMIDGTQLHVVGWTSM